MGLEQSCHAEIGSTGMIAGRSVVASVLSCWYSVEIGPFDEATGVLKKCPDGTAHSLPV